MPSHIAESDSSAYRSSVIHEIYDQMSRTPDAIAVTDGDLEWTYDVLRRRSDVAARSLAARGIRRGDVVGVHLPRCADAIAAMLGIMVSGCVYLPLDSSYPAARLRSILDRAKVAAVISADSDEDLYGTHRIWLPSPSQPTAEPEVPTGEFPIHSADREPFGPKDCAYILFTSGSTGEPKGVMVSHENITLMNDWSAKLLGINSLDASATTCSLSFDPSFHEVMLPLSVGGTVHVIPHALALGQLTRQVSLVATTPTVASELLRAGQLPSLKTLMLGGEVLTPDVAARLLSSGRVGTLLNCYGPTECTVCVTLAEVTAPVPDIIPIGRQVPGTEVLILDENGQRLPDGEIGEICVFGGQVTQGYVNDPAETSERFAIGPGASTEPERYYRTGDLGYRTDDGLIYFCGRADRQVKINGIRIELGEIDTALRSHPQVADAITTVRQSDQMVAYVMPAWVGMDIDIADLRKYLAKRLPRFMVPAGIVVVDKFPKTVNGKLDSAALPDWSPGRPGRDTRAVDDVDEVTAHVTKIIAEVTGFTGQILASDNFIDDLGGTSLGIVRVMVELERYSGKRLRINDALADTSIAGLASLIREEVGPSPADFAFNTDGDAPPLFLIHTYFGGMLALRRLAKLLPPNQPVYGLHVYGNDAERLDSELTVSSLAREAANRIRQIRPIGDFAMIGQSAGGLIAFEVARRILQAERIQPRVLLLDTTRPFTFGYDWGEWVLHWRENLRHPGRALRAAGTRLSRLVVSPGRRPLTISRTDDLLVLNEKNLESIAAALRSHKSQPYNGSITVMSTRQGRVMALGRPSLGWASVTGGTLKIIDVPGAHLTLLDAPHIQTVAEGLIDWLSADGR